MPSWASSMLRAKVASFSFPVCGRLPLLRADASSILRASPDLIPVKADLWKSLWKSRRQSSERHFSLIVMASPSKENPPTDMKTLLQRLTPKDDLVPMEHNRNRQTRKKIEYIIFEDSSTILRHRAEEFHLKIRPDGYVAVRDVLKLGAKTIPGIPLAVETEQLLRPIFSADEVPVCVHGTSMNNLNSILRTGLQKMRRNHVHFATGLPSEDGVISGMISRSDALIYLDAKKALEDGMKLFMSDNGVVLTEGFGGVIPPKYFAQVAKWKKGKIIPIDLSSKKELR